jgi:uncharacterized protein YyaL (SSP411 family)
MFFYASATTENLVVRKMEILDNVIPSSNGVMAEVLYYLNTYFENNDYLNKSTRMLSKISNQMASQTAFYSQWCLLSGLRSYGTNEVAIVGENAKIKNLELQKSFLPQCIFMGETDEENLPLLEGKISVNKTLIYVCTNKTCKLPVQEVSIALQQLNSQVNGNNLAH